MKPPPDSPFDRWEQLATRAHDDRPPPLDPASALRAARTAAARPAAAATPSWLEDFAAVFGTPRRLVGCGGAAALVLLAALWLGTDIWTQLGPWADLVGPAVEVSS